MKMKISLGQMDIRLGNQEKNFLKVGKWVAEAARRGSDIVLFPELWSTGYDLENSEKHANKINQGMFKKVSLLAKKHRIFIGGSLLEIFNNKIYNSFTIYNSSGELVDFYRKIHLFGLMDEPTWLSAGDRLVTLNVSKRVCGLAICYDLRFPELFLKYSDLGVDLILLVAEWPGKRIAHWQTLLKARAIDNQSFVAAVNRVGISKNEKFGGKSSVISPWGNVLFEGDSDEDLFTVEIDFNDVKKIRKKIPVLIDRRKDVFR